MLDAEVGVASKRRYLKLRRSFSDPKFFWQRSISLFSRFNSSSIEENEELISAYRPSVLSSVRQEIRVVGSLGNLGCGLVRKQIRGWVHRIIEIGKKARFW